MSQDMTGVAVVGSISADLSVFGSPLPRRGETVRAESFSMVLGGKGANQALASARAGAATFMIGAVGDDEFRNLTLGQLTSAGVDTTGVAVLDAVTGIAHIRVDTATGDNDIAIVAGANDGLSADLAEEKLRAVAGRVSVLLVQLETAQATVERVVTVAADLGISVILDPAPAARLPDSLWARVAVATPNETEAELITGIAVTDPATAGQAGQWFLDRGTERVVVTLGSRGAVAIGPTPMTHYPPFDVPAIDSTAAGDAFTGALGAALADGLPWELATRRGLAAGALATTVRGASPSLPTAQQVSDLLATRG